MIIIILLIIIQVMGLNLLQVAQIKITLILQMGLIVQNFKKEEMSILKITILII